MMCQIFMTPTKNDQFFWNNNEKNEQQIHRLKTIESENMWQISYPPPSPSAFGTHVSLQHQFASKQFVKSD